jgi:glycosyltransferase involved in cell wall biosynthesis
MDKIQVLIVGPINGYGGIASVIKSICNHGFSEKFVVGSLNTFVAPEIGIKNRLASIFSIVIRFFSLLSNKEIQIVHVHTSAGLSFIRKSILSLIALKYAKKVILHLHASRFYDFYINQPNPFLRFYIRVILSRVTCVVPLCRDWKNEIDRLNIVKNVRILNNPVDLEVDGALFAKGKRNKSRINLLFMGEFESRKGIIDLLEAISMLRKKNEKFTLFLCGKGTLGAYVDSFVSANSLAENIVNCGWVSGQKKKKLLSNTDIFILPSYNEGVPIAILEAFSYGIPVISTNISGIPELVIDNRNGMLITPGDKIGLYLGILKLIENPELRQRFGCNNVLDVKKYSVKNVVLQWQALYESMV